MPRHLGLDLERLLGREPKRILDPIEKHALFVYEFFVAQSDANGGLVGRKPPQVPLEFVDDELGQTALELGSLTKAKAPFGGLRSD